MDLPQILLLSAICIVSVILTVIGIQLIFLLREARASLRQLDHILTNLDFLTTSFTRTSSTLHHLSVGLQSGLQLASLVASLLQKNKKTAS